MTQLLNRYGLRRKLGLDDVYPKSTQVLLWIGTSIGIIITSTVFLIKAHAHTEYVTQNELNRVIDSQILMQSKLDSMSIDILNQTKIMLDFQHKVVKEWLRQPGQ